MQRSICEINGLNIKMYTVDTLVIGTGCAGFNAADTLYDFNHKNIAIVTEGVKMGTSRNTGSDKQTYYKLSLASGDADSVDELAKTLFEGGSVNGDTALIEAACSVRSFMKLVNLGVPFPTNEYGEYIGYMTDHDKRKRATSAGPLTSKYMTECLEKSVNSKKIDIIDNTVIFKLFEDKGAIKGALGYDRVKEQFVLFRCANIIMATGGHSMIYENNVYPNSQTGMTGMALEVGARGANLQEWQYGLASVDFKWNLSGTYQQVIPKYISVDENGVEREFLLDYFEDLADTANYVFMKGYQWPFDIAKINGSSAIDLMVYNESVNKKRAVYMDFREEPTALKDGFGLLSDEAYDYLKNSDALIEKPINRLRKMNNKAIELYKAHGIDLYNEPLRITVSAQHTNGGIAVDANWESSIKGLYAVGEVAGTFGVYRPGGSALNSTQAGSLRAAEHIAFQKNPAEIMEVNAFLKLAEEALYEVAKLNIEENDEFGKMKAKIKEFSADMYKMGAHIRNAEGMNELYKKTSDYIDNIDKYISKVSRKDLTDYLKFKDMLVTQNAVLKSMMKAFEEIGSRGGALVCNSEVCLDTATDIYKLCVSGNTEFNDRIIYTEYKNAKSECFVESVRTIPERDNWFENVWNEYLDRRSIND